MRLKGTPREPTGWVERGREGPGAMWWGTGVRARRRTGALERVHIHSRRFAAGRNSLTPRSSGWEGAAVARRYRGWRRRADGRQGKGLLGRLRTRERHVRSRHMGRAKVPGRHASGPERPELEGASGRNGLPWETGTGVPAGAE